MIYFASLVLISAAIIHLIIGISILIKNRTKKINVIYFILCLTLSLWSLLYSISYLTVNDFQTLFFTRVLTIPSFFYPVLFLYLSFIFPEDKYRVKKAFAIYHSLFIALFLSSIFSNNYISEAHLVTEGIYFKSGLVYNILGVYILTTMFYGCYILLRKLIILKNIKYQMQIPFVCLGALISILFGAIFGVILPILKIPQYNFFAPAGTIFVIIFWGYAITKHELMDIKLLITRSVAYGTSIVCVLLLGIGTVYFNRIVIPQNMMFQFISVSALCLLSIKIFEPIRDFIQTPIEDKWITTSYNSDKVLNSISKELIPVFEKEQAIKTISKVLKENIKIGNINILLIDKNHNSNQFKCRILDSKNEDLEQLNSDHPFINFIINHKDLLSYDKLDGIVKNSIENILILRNAVYLSLFSSKGLDGIIILGAKISEDPYNEKDFALFRIVMNQATIVLDRITPFEQIKSELVLEHEKVDKAQKEIEKVSKLATLGTLAAGLAHEIKNPMTVLRSRAERGLNRLEDKDFIKESNELMIRNIDRTLGIVERMLKFGKISGGQGKIKIQNVINESLNLLAEKINDHNILVEKEFVDNDEVLGNLDSLSESFLNLFLNSIEAMQKGGALKIKTSSAKITDINNHEKDAVKIEIEDTGEGIPKENLSRVFDPFFTTRHTGTGLGLSIVQRIILEEHKGSLDIESNPGKGTKVIILLPK